MSAEQLATRLLGEEARVSGDRIRRGDIGQQRLRPVRAGVSREIAALPIYIDDTPAITMSALRTRARRLKRTKGLALIVIDYLQLMRPAAGTQAGKPGAGDQPDHPGAEGARQGAGRAGAGAVAALARRREPRGQAAAALRPARIRLDRAGRRRGDVHLPRRVLPRAARAEADRAFDSEDKFQAALRRVAARRWSGCTTRPS